MQPEGEKRLLALQMISDQQTEQVLAQTLRRRLETISRLEGLPIEDCKDAAQETLISALILIKGGRFRGDSSVNTLVFSILKRKIVDYYRRQNIIKNNEVCFCSAWQLKGVQHIESFPALLPPPEIKLLAERGLAALPNQHRHILLLNLIQGLTIAEISSKIRRSKGTVGRMLAEAKQIFRAKVT